MFNQETNKLIILGKNIDTIPSNNNFKDTVCNNIAIVGIKYDNSLAIINNKNYELMTTNNTFPIVSLLSSSDKYKELFLSLLNDKFQAISCGTDHFVALRTNGTVITFGDNTNNQYNNSPDNTHKFKSISCGTYHSIGLKEDNTIMVWGNNDNWQCSITKFKLFNEMKCKAIACGGQYTGVINEDNKILLWGNCNNLPDKINRDFIKIGCGAKLVVGLTNFNAIIIREVITSKEHILLPNIHNLFTTFECGNEHIVILREDGTVITWNLSDSKHLALLDEINNNFVAIACGSYNSIGLKSDNTVVTWDCNTSGHVYNYSNCIKIFGSSGNSDISLAIKFN